MRIDLEHVIWGVGIIFALGGIYAQVRENSSDLEERKQAYLKSAVMWEKIQHNTDTLVNIQKDMSSNHTELINVINRLLLNNYSNPQIHTLNSLQYLPNED